jgi:aminoglycoside/choline kinase family phosphotransferase
MPNLVTQLQTILESELARQTNATSVQARVAESIFGFAVDNPKIEQELILEALALLSDLGREALRDAVNAAKRIFFENETLEVLTRERVLERRKPQRASAIELAKNNDLEGLRRIGARALQLGLQAAKPDVAKVIIEAWELLSQYERSHT